jgi:hypothetical protein
VEVAGVEGGCGRGKEKLVKPAPMLKINTELDKRTAIKPSMIPGAGTGPNYDYGFMAIAEVWDFFCGLVKMDCSDGYAFEP